MSIQLIVFLGVSVICMLACLILEHRDEKLKREPRDLNLLCALISIALLFIAWLISVINDGDRAILFSKFVPLGVAFIVLAFTTAILRSKYIKREKKLQQEVDKEMSFDLLAASVLFFAYFTVASLGFLIFGLVAKAVGITIGLAIGL